ncbi:hypothetical protein SEUBUCD646_0M04080 [Saccharomyces eubayanus]|uniref:Uncharacterized protein n=1 Tax=Saccharomyces eubayanus TaxID=1080349 RepID=A0ABN8VLN9_SACEU|nr:hypothetical protein DI49_4356 [Saccharomyces eubayanus]KOG97600.1 hypothetical protein DI49_4356 [Saccharomyces eubayanus]CAI1654499.1 hypothetical protein SEUBUCD650_0M04020 [Saccharomyces eubayanus]CAI1684445.1 hypothetical protein SEUBUCD646_0M04080 [Saccharomyces eubayanus]
MWNMQFLKKFLPAFRQIALPLVNFTLKKETGGNKQALSFAPLSISFIIGNGYRLAKYPGMKGSAAVLEELQDKKVLDVARIHKQIISPENWNFYLSRRYFNILLFTTRSSFHSRNRLPLLSPQSRNEPSRRIFPPGLPISVNVFKPSTRTVQRS